jgi:hypothetical protein
MRNPFPAFFSILALAACTAQPSPPPTAGAPPASQALTPTSYAAGSPANTTTAFDGTYNPGAVRNMSAGSALPGGGEGFSSCPNYTASPVVISGGLAQFDVLNIRFQGYVTPQGSLAMRTGVGQRFEGQIDPQGVIHGRVIGACVYDASWRRSA